MEKSRQCRKIQSPPLMGGFKPFDIRISASEPVVMLYDEYESLRLLDYDGLTQEEAAKKMGVSRPTLTRIYEKARKKIAVAFVEGRQLEINGGNVDFEKRWYKCKKCHKLIMEQQEHTRCKNCRLFGNDELITINKNK
ncbi:MAG: DUF134 domain-containing protein [Bacteroidales bacterium]|nr:DUF134 domain-containing protein [Bacteroidales bacterium]